MDHKFNRQWDQVGGGGDLEPAQPPEGLYCVKLEKWPRLSCAGPVGIEK